MSRLAKNALYMTFASIAQKLIAFFYFAIIARFFGAEATGAYFLALAIVTIVAVLEDVGITSVIIREVARKTNDAVIWARTVMGIKVLTIPFAVAVALILPNLIGYDPQISKLIQIAVFIMVADTLSLSFFGILRGLQELKFEAIGIFIGQVLTASIGIFLMVTGKATLELLVLALIVGSVWNMFFSAFFVYRRLGFKAFIPTYQMGWKPIKIAFAFFLAAIFVKVYSYVDSFILQEQLGNEAVGIYAVAYKLTYAFQFLPLAFVGALYPSMSEQSDDPVRLKRVLMNAFWYLSLLAGPIVFGIWALAPEIISTFYGVDFMESAIVLQILVFVLLFIFIDFPLGSLLNATNRQVTKTTIGFITMLINIGANLILIPIYAVSGAALAALLSFAFMLCADWFFAKKAVKINLLELFGQVGRIFIVSIIMAVIVMFAKQYIHFVLAIPLGAVVYIAGLFLTGAINKEHLRTLRTLLKRKPYVESSPTDH